MSAPDMQTARAELSAVLRAGWQWWRGEMAALVPESLRRRLAAGPAIVAIDLEGDWVVLRRFADGGGEEIGRLPRAGFNAKTLRAALESRLSTWRPLRDAFALRLPAAPVLKRTLSLPFAARGNIGSLLDIELERQSPVDRSEIYHDYRIVRTDRQAGRIDVVWRIVRRRNVDPVLAVCREAGIGLAVIAFTGDETPPEGGNFPVDARASLFLRLRRRLVPALAVLVVVLSLATVWGAYGRNQEALDDLALRVEGARAEAQTSARLEHAIATARKRSALLLREKRGASVTQMLAETTRLLPDGTWLTGFAYRNGEVRIQGVSNAAPSLIALFDKSPLFTAAEFRAPLTQAQNQAQERFDLAFKLRKGGR